MKNMKLVLAMLIMGTIGNAVNSIADNDLMHKSQQRSIAKNQKPSLSQTTCPVMGEEVNKKLYVDHNGKRIYVCCKGCINAVNADPEKYIKKMEQKDITLQKVDLITQSTTKQAVKTGTKSCQDGGTKSCPMTKK